ncbi:30S ribosomal protein S9 [candidate division GN15 bacterium]|uniref:Small ribosomal subunit protein uS9 n=1 Tax=candidate division GN15 bacterium TaxID=2072418 RepID=A0A855WXK7_9BACT|nr:MAG: 30S ribosomal protein S9 [candidate division GN15 bacterium]
MEQNSFAASGRRKEAVARVTIIPGKGAFVVNGTPIADYLQREILVDHAREPLVMTEMDGKFDISCVAKGGGKSGQAGAIRLAVSRALSAFNPDVRSALRREGMLTRDPRQVERKKYGRPKARKRFQYSKR